ncbi:MAG: D-glycero-beta-D-manno-heptose 1-phosphate adenylyltransferase [Verrucomicrobiales bacterium]|nr:D-glycero-beta-D-manno-heptose 1-phosphate adenylyltransferase [Verrucomicrobiales bacterium]
MEETVSDLSDIKKFVPRQNLPELLEQLRREGKKIVFTNGCFDLLHVGHVLLLRESKELADVLIVGLNEDESVRRRKGEGRPVRNLGQRVAYMAEVDEVDYMTSFDEDDVTNLLLEISPDIYTKGGDYVLDTVDESLKKAIEEKGIDVRFLSLEEGVSTTNILKTGDYSAIFKKDE